MSNNILCGSGGGRLGFIQKTQDLQNAIVTFEKWYPHCESAFITATGGTDSAPQYISALLTFEFFFKMILNRQLDISPRGWANQFFHSILQQLTQLVRHLAVIYSNLLNPVLCVVMATDLCHIIMPSQRQWWPVRRRPHQRLWAHL